MPASHKPSRALGPAVREHRDRLGLSRKAAARRWDVHPAWLARLERGEANPSLERLRALTDRMGVALSRLLQRSEELDGP
ncbi:MAG: Helix-turn-helix domain [Solirubrobacteraceae bacterium]|jgi:transcriptional regulator with XRE-family HTH domain|nr:Helix-turn-helix domain [Solirubrobacteraceae bacterium]